jgi:hypothetical protein
VYEGFPLPSPGLAGQSPRTRPVAAYELFSNFPAPLSLPHVVHLHQPARDHRLLRQWLELRSGPPSLSYRNPNCYPTANSCAHIPAVSFQAYPSALTRIQLPDRSCHSILSTISRKRGVKPRGLPFYSATTAVLHIISSVPSRQTQHLLHAPSSVYDAIRSTKCCLHRSRIELPRDKRRSNGCPHSLSRSYPCRHATCCPLSLSDPSSAHRHGIPRSCPRRRDEGGCGPPGGQAARPSRRQSLRLPARAEPRLSCDTGS